MTCIRPFLLLLSLAASTTPARAQEDVQQWISASAKTDLTERIALQGEIISRFSNDRDGLYEIEGALLIGYRLSERVTAWAGYVHNPTYVAGDFAVMERRARQQLTIDDFAAIGPFALSARMRMEQRWRDGISGAGWRARPHLRAALPLGGGAAPILNLSAEAFVNLNTTAFQPSSGLERLRSAVALSFPVARSVRLEAGYLNQRRFIVGAADTDDHVLTVTLGLSL